MNLIAVINFYDFWHKLHNSNSCDCVNFITLCQLLGMTEDSWVQYYA